MEPRTQMHVARRSDGAYRQTVTDRCPRCGRQQPTKTPLTEAVTRLIECGIRFRKTTNRDELVHLRQQAAQARERMTLALDAELAAMAAILAATPAQPDGSDTRGPRAATRGVDDRQTPMPFLDPPPEIAPTLVALKAGRRIALARIAVPPAQAADDAENRWSEPPPFELRALGDQLLSA